MIKQIRIQNFRSLVGVTVNLDPLTVLIGRSGTGKSNFVDAIRFLRDCLTKRSVDFNAAGGTPRLFHFAHGKEPLEYEILFSIEGFDSSFRYLVQFQPNGLVSEEWLESGERRLFHQAASKWAIPPEVVSRETGNPSGIMLGAIPGLQLSTFAYVALRSGIGCYDFPGHVLSGPGNQGQPADRGLADNGENYLHIADRILSDLSKAQNWKRIAKSMLAVNRSVGGLTLNAPVPDRIMVGLGLNGRIVPLDVRQESEGFRRFLAHMLALYQTPSKQTLMFEHPEAGLHPGALESLAYEFKECPEEGRGQVIVTTHSPEFLHYFPATSIRVVDIENQQTRIGPLAPEQLKAVEEHLLLPGELLTVDAARLEGQLAEVPG